MTAEWAEASSEVVHIAQELILKHHPHLCDANIGFLFRSEAATSKGKLVYGQASKVPEKLRPYLDYDFLIWLSEEDYASMGTERRTALIDHELCHCVGENGNWSICGHDVEEFNGIIERYGLWRSELILVDHAIEQYKQGTLIKRDNIGKVESVVVDMINAGALNTADITCTAEVH